MAKAKSTKQKAASSAPEPNQVCFVIMPFGGWLDDYYQSIYCPAIEAAGLLPHRADDLFRPSTIVNDIWAYTKRAKLLIADLTGKNPNVFYELGLAHALTKPAILVAESMEDIPFDLRALRVILFDKNAPNWGAILQEKIERALKEVLAAPAEAVLPAFLDVRSETPKPKVSQEQKEFIEIKQELELLRRELRSRSGAHRSGRSSSDVGPATARKLLRTLLSEGLYASQIVDILQPLGAPRRWIEDEIAELGREPTEDR